MAIILMSTNPAPINDKTVGIWCITNTWKPKPKTISSDLEIEGAIKEVRILKATLYIENRA